MKSVPLHIKVLLAVLIAMVIISVNNTFANRDVYNDIISEVEFEQFSTDVEVGLSQLDLLVKEPPISFSEVDEVKRLAGKKKDEYLTFKTENMMAAEIAAVMTSGFSMLEKALGEYKYNKREAEQDYEESMKSFNEVLRILNKIHNDVI